MMYLSLWRVRYKINYVSVACRPDRETAKRPIWRANSMSMNTGCGEAEATWRRNARHRSFTGCRNDSSSTSEGASCTRSPLAPTPPCS